MTNTWEVIGEILGNTTWYVSEHLLVLYESEIKNGLTNVDINPLQTGMEHSLHTFICLDSAAAFSFLQK